MKYVQQDATLHSLFYLEIIPIKETLMITKSVPLKHKDAQVTKQIVTLLEQFSDKINCVTLHLVGHILEYSYDARTHKR
jgi:hypothetical protein